MYIFCLCICIYTNEKKYTYTHIFWIYTYILEIHICILSLTVLVTHQFTCVFWVVEIPTPNTLLQMWSNKWWVSLPSICWLCCYYSPGWCVLSSPDVVRAHCCKQGHCIICSNPKTWILAIPAAPDLEIGILSSGAHITQVFPPKDI